MSNIENGSNTEYLGEATIVFEPVDFLVENNVDLSVDVTETGRVWNAGGLYDHPTLTNYISINRKLPVIPNATYHFTDFRGIYMLYGEDGNDPAVVHSDWAEFDLVIPENRTEIGISFSNASSINYFGSIKRMTPIGDEATVGYERLCILPNNLKGEKIKNMISPLKDKIILNLGDSIFALDRTENISQYLSEYSGATVYNGAFGGTRMTNRGGSTAYNWFDGVNLVNALTTGNWENYDTYAVGCIPDSYTGIPEEHPYVVTLNMLKSLDMSKVDIITLAWGSNDWHAGGKSDSDVCAALETIIDKIQASYPKIRILVITPIWRESAGEDGSVENSKGVTLLEMAEAIEACAKKKRVSVLNSYYNMPLCANTKALYMESDGTHLKSAGNALYAHLINGKLKSMY